MTIDSQHCGRILPRMRARKELAAFISGAAVLVSALMISGSTDATAAGTSRITGTPGSLAPTASMTVAYEGDEREATAYGGSRPKLVLATDGVTVGASPASSTRQVVQVQYEVYIRPVDTPNAWVRYALPSWSNVGPLVSSPVSTLVRGEVKRAVDGWVVAVPNAPQTQQVYRIQADITWRDEVTSKVLATATLNQSLATEGMCATGYYFCQKFADGLLV